MSLPYGSNGLMPITITHNRRHQSLITKSQLPSILCVPRPFHGSVSLLWILFLSSCLYSTLVPSPHSEWEHCPALWLNHKVASCPPFLPDLSFWAQGLKYPTADFFSPPSDSATAIPGQSYLVRWSCGSYRLFLCLLFFASYVTSEL